MQLPHSGAVHSHVIMLNYFSDDSHYIHIHTQEHKGVVAVITFLLSDNVSLFPTGTLSAVRSATVKVFYQNSLRQNKYDPLRTTTTCKYFFEK